MHLDSTHFWSVPQSSVVTQSTQMPSALLHTCFVALQSAPDWHVAADTHFRWLHTYPASPQSLLFRQGMQTCFASSQTPLLHEIPALESQGGSAVTQPAFLACMHCPVEPSHESSVQASASSHTLPAPGLQADLSHTSFSVHALPSSQGSVFGLCPHALTESSQLSSVQRLPSSQPLLTCWHFPSVHVSFVQAFLSSQSTPAQAAPASGSVLVSGPAVVAVPSASGPTTTSVPVSVSATASVAG
jgi:hypothetical protein